MSEEKNPTTASATEHDPVIAGTPEAAGASPASVAGEGRKR